MYIFGVEIRKHMRGRRRYDTTKYKRKECLDEEQRRAQSLMPASGREIYHEE